MMSRLVRLVCLALVGYLLAGCSPQTDDLQAFTAQIRQTTPVQVEPYPEFKSQPAFAYSASELKSPFSRPLDRSSPVVMSVKSNCLQPDFDRAKEKLEQYGLDALSMTGSFKSQGTQWVLFKTIDGQLLKARKGSHIGLFYGKITHIDEKSITIEQLLPDGAGCWQREETTLTMRAAAGENNNV